MFYDDSDYMPLFNPRKKAEDGGTASAAALKSRLWGAARERGYDLDEWAVSRADNARVEGIIAKAIAGIAPAAPARAASVKGDRVEAKAFTPAALADFLSDAIMDRKGVSFLAQRRGTETWVGVCGADPRGGPMNLVVARVQGAFPLAEDTDTLVAYRQTETDAVLRLLKSNAENKKYAARRSEPTDDMAAAWEGLLNEWDNKATWKRLTLTQAARSAVRFVGAADNRYGLAVVVWDKREGFERVPSAPGIEPLSAPFVRGVFVTTDGNRLAAIGVDAAPDRDDVQGVQMPRAMFDYCRPVEALGRSLPHWGKTGTRAMAMGPFLSFGTFVDFPAVRDVLPTRCGGHTVLSGAALSAFDLPPKTLLGGLKGHQLINHAAVYMRAERVGDTLTQAARAAPLLLDMLVRYVPEGGDPLDLRAFPAERVGRFPFRRDDGDWEAAQKPHILQALFTSDTLRTCREAGDTEVSMCVGAVLSPVVFASPTQMHIIMPVRPDEMPVERAYQSASGELAGGSGGDVTFAGDFSYYPEGTVAENTSREAYSGLWSALTKDVYKRARNDLFVFPVEGPNGPETWLQGSATRGVIRLPGALVEQSYHANDDSKRNALLAQILRTSALPATLSPGNSPPIKPEEAATRLRDMEDPTVSDPHRQRQIPPRIIGAAALFAGAERDHGVPVHLFSDGTVTASNGRSLFYAKTVAWGGESVKGEIVELPPAITYELYEQNAGILSVGEKVLAAGRVAVRRHVNPTGFRGTWDRMVSDANDRSTVFLTFDVSALLPEVRKARPDSPHTLLLDEKGLYYFPAGSTTGRVYLTSMPGDPDMKTTGVTRDLLLNALEAAKRLGWKTAVLSWGEGLPMLLLNEKGARSTGDYFVTLALMASRVD